MSVTLKGKKNAAMRKPRNPAQSRAAILSAAVDEFAERGFEGARIEAIAQNTATTRAMVYYYFGSKEVLYLAVLESVYQGIRDAEANLDLQHTEPREALGRLVSFTFDYYRSHPSFVRIVVAENQTGGRFVREMKRIRSINRPIIQAIGDVLDRGAREGVFRRHLHPIDVHMLISSLAWFQSANRHTFGWLFGRDFMSKIVAARHKALGIETMLRFVAAQELTTRRATRETASRGGAGSLLSTKKIRVAST